MLIFGSGTDTINVRDEGKTTCPVCECKRRFSLVLNYGYGHIYYVFGFVSFRNYYITCNVCGRGEEINRTDIDPPLERDPIPFMRRHGLVLIPVIFCHIVALGALIEFLVKLVKT